MRRLPDEPENSPCMNKFFLAAGMLVAESVTVTIAADAGRPFSDATRGLSKYLSP